MTEAEKALVDMVLSGHDSDANLESARRAILKERLPPGLKERWQEAYRVAVLARDTFRRAVDALNVPDVDLGDWRAEVHQELGTPGNRRAT